LGALICRPQVDFGLGTRDRLLADERLPLLPPLLLQARTTSHVRFGSSSSYSSHQARLALDYLPFVGLISYIFHCYIAALCTKIYMLNCCCALLTPSLPHTHIYTLTPMFRTDILFRISCFISSPVLAFAQIADTTFCNFRGGWNVIIFKPVNFILFCSKHVL